MKQYKFPHSQQDLADVAQMYKALGDETRLRILGLLRAKELCVCDIMEALSLPQSTASRHLAYLKNSGWVSGRRVEKWMYYKRNHPTTQAKLFDEIVNNLIAIPRCKDDSLVLEKHLKKKNKQECE